MSEQQHDPHVEDDAPPPPAGYGSAVAHDPPPPPRSRGPHPSQQQGWGPGGPRDLPPHLRDPFARGDGRYGGPDPFQLLQHPTDSNVVRVERVRCNGDETDETGFCGIVARTMGFEQEIRHKWGGGQYIVTTTVNGRAEDRPVNIGGVSKPLASTGEDEGEGEGEGEGESSSYDYSDYYPSSYRYRGRRSYYDDDPYDSGFGGGYGSRYGRGRYGQGGYGQGGNGFGGGGGGFGGGGGGFGGGGGGGFNPNPYGPGPYGQQQQQQGFNPYQQQHGFSPYQQQQAQPGYYQPNNPFQPAGYQPPGMVPVPGAPGNVYMPAPQQEPERNEEVEALRAQIEQTQDALREAQDLAAQEREERRLEAERNAAREREAAMQREMDRMKLEQERRDDDFRRQLEENRRASEQQMQQLMMQIQTASTQGPSAMDRMIEMQMASMQQDRARAEAARIEREQRQREEAMIRREDVERREKERARSDEVREKRRHEERLREEQWRQDERLRDEQRRQQSDAHYQHLISMFQSSQPKPGEALENLKALVALRPEKDTFEEIQKLAGVAMMVKDLVGPNEPQQEGKWESIIRTGSEALGRAIGDIQAKRAAQEEAAMQQQAVMMQQAGYPQQQAYMVPAEQHPALPGPQAGYPAQQVQPQQAAYAPPADPTLQDPTGPEWGRILGFAVDAHDSGNDPETTATHLHTMVNVGMQRPRALEQLEGGTTDELRLKLSAMLMSADVARSQYKVKIDRMLEILNIEMTPEHKADPEQEVYGREWVEELLSGLSEIQAAMREAVAQIHRAEVHAPQHHQQYAAPTQPPPAGPGAPPADPNMDPASFAAQSRGGPVVTPPPADPNMDPAAFAAQSRGNEEPPVRDPTNGWG